MAQVTQIVKHIEELDNLLGQNEQCTRFLSWLLGQPELIPADRLIAWAHSELVRQKAERAVLRARYGDPDVQP